MIPALITLLFVGGLVVIFFVLGRFIPLRNAKAELFGRLIVNLVMSALAFVTAALLVRPAATAAMGWAGRERFGLIHLVELPAAAQFVIAFLLMGKSGWVDSTSGFKFAGTTSPSRSCFFCMAARVFRRCRLLTFMRNSNES